MTRANGLILFFLNPHLRAGRLQGLSKHNSDKNRSEGSNSNMIKGPQPPRAPARVYIRGWLNTQARTPASQDVTFRFQVDVESLV